MIIKSAQFITSNTSVDKCPEPLKPEYAFIGRSNVGKSSLINMLTNQKGLAKTSSKPGKTQLINHFLINEVWYLVDLPGYGFAKVAKSLKSQWDKMIENYLLKRPNLMNVFLLIDSRLEPQKIDLAFMNWLGMKNIPFSLVFTKIDKLKLLEKNNNINNYKKQLLENWEELPPIFITSSETQLGKEEILTFIDETNNLFKN